MIYCNRNCKSFTLIELLIVVGIIGILTGVIIAIINPAQLRKEARDATRRSDLAVISAALEQYYADNNQYPDTSGGDEFSAMAGIITGAYIKNVPNDPLVDDGYSYCYNNGTDATTTPQEFILCSQLESTTTDELNGIDSGIVCNPAGSGSAKYCVTNPF